jgi:DNA repair exonuclease SbcCD ATPase subunit
MLEEELVLALDKLDRKNKVVSELQRSVAQTQSSFSAAQRQVKELEARLGEKEAEQQRLSQALRLAEKRISHHDEAVRRIRSSHEAKAAAATSEINSHASRIVELEKSVRILQNDKAVLAAALEARDGKLSRMTSLQQSYDSLSEKVAANESLQNELQNMSKRYKDKCSELNSALELQLSKQAELDEVRSELASVMAYCEKERSIVSSQKAEHEQLQIKIQKATAERNNYKQKSESLSKEMARVCKNGRTIREIEKILAEDASRNQEVEVLREQKKRATDELQRYQILYEQARRVQLMAGIDCDVSKVLERNEELERLLSELTEYVSAKEMQLETMKQINDALQAEIRDLAKVNMSKNDV